MISYYFLIDVKPVFKVLVILTLILVIMMLLLKIIEVIRRMKKNAPAASHEEPKNMTGVIDVSQALEDIKKSIDELKKSIQEKMPGVHGLKPGGDKNGFGLVERPEPPLFEDFSEPDDLAGCIHLYNTTIADEQRQSEFNKRFKPIRVDVINALDRRRDPKLNPQFQSSNSGDLLVVEINGARPTSFVVFPRFELTIYESNYRAGAFGEVFHCPIFNPKQRYSVHSVQSPAFFSMGQSGSWTLERKGELELTPVRFP